MKNTLNIILLSSAFNGLTQRVWLSLKEAGYQVSFLLFTTEQEVIDSIETAHPDLVICPFLKDRVPEVLWKNETRPIIIIHPGIRGDRGASSLDWAILKNLDTWGVTALQAVEEMDAGPIWASHEFKKPALIRKSELYNNFVSDAAIQCIFEVIDKFINKEKPIPLDYNNENVKGRLEPNMKQSDRHFEWTSSAKDILNIINSAEGIPGVLAEIEGEKFYIYDAYLDLREGEAGKLLARREDAVLIGTGEKSLWIGSLKRAAKDQLPFKLPAVQVLKEKAESLKDLTLSLYDTVLSNEEYSTIHYSQKGKIGELTFNFYNGAMSTQQCERMIKAVQFAKEQETNVLIIKGGYNAFSNGVHLNTIEAAENPAEEAWKNIHAIDDVCLELLDTKQWVIAGVTGSAGAGGVMLALTADFVAARDGIILNPHYATMGLYGSEYWTYTLPKRVGEQQAKKLTEECLPVSVTRALEIGLIDSIGPREINNFNEWLWVQAKKAEEVNKKASKKPFNPEKAAECRKKELEEMKEDMLYDRNSFSVKRNCFVLKKRACNTPDRLIANWARVKQNKE